jgi:hypothetical protein
MIIRKVYQGQVPENAIMNGYSSSDTNTYACSYLNGTILYNNTSGTSGNVKLSDNTTNYKSLKLLIYNIDWQEYLTFDVLTDKNNVMLSGTFVSDASYDVFSILLTLSGTLITRRKTQFYNGSRVFAYNPFKIIKVLGNK